MSLASKFLAKTTEHLRAYEARLQALCVALAPIESIVIPEGQSVADEIDRMQNNRVVWSLLESAARKTYRVKYAKAMPRDFLAETTNWLALIVGHLLVGVYVCFVVDSENDEFEPTYGENVANQTYRERYNIGTQNRISVDPLPIHYVIRTLLEHVSQTEEIAELLSELGSIAEAATRAAAAKRDCADEACRDQPNECTCAKKLKYARTALSDILHATIGAIAGAPEFYSLQPVITEALDGRVVEENEHGELTLLANEADERLRAERIAADRERHVHFGKVPSAFKEKRTEDDLKRAASSSSESTDEKRAKLT
jgi:hypothetical protein